MEKQKIQVGHLAFQFCAKVQDNKILTEVLDGDVVIYTQLVPLTDIKRLIDFFHTQVYTPTGPYDKEQAKLQAQSIEDEVMRNLGQI